MSLGEYIQTNADPNFGSTMVWMYSGVRPFPSRKILVSVASTIMTATFNVGTRYHTCRYPGKVSVSWTSTPGELQNEICFDFVYTRI